MSTISKQNKQNLNKVFRFSYLFLLKTMVKERKTILILCKSSLSFLSSYQN